MAVCGICLDLLSARPTQNVEHYDDRGEVLQEKISHIFHSQCLDEWVRAAPRLPVPCPTCMRSIVKMDSVPTIELKPYLPPREASDISALAARPCFLSDLKTQRILLARILGTGEVPLERISEFREHLRSMERRIIRNYATEYELSENSDQLPTLSGVEILFQEMRQLLDSAQQSRAAISR